MDISPMDISPTGQYGYWALCVTDISSSTVNAGAKQESIKLAIVLFDREDLGHYARTDCVQRSQYDTAE